VDRYEGFREFVAARERALLRTAFLLSGDAHLAEDLVQTALAKVAGRWRRLARDGNPEAYARKIMYHEHISWWRRRGRRQEYPQADPPEPGALPDIADRAVRRLALERALALLTPRQRAVIVLRFYEDRSEADTADLMSCTVGTVKSQTHRALRRLRELAPELAEFIGAPDRSEVLR
jgi:RNA polymerase sigma-70 factor (sigma-E family)